MFAFQFDDSVHKLDGMISIQDSTRGCYQINPEKKTFGSLE